MSKVPQALIDEATRRGIVPGARINCAFGHGQGTVAPYSMWQNFDTSLWCGSDDFGNSLRARSYGRWATVIGTAPSEGLKDGDATECGPAMRAAIIELAKELGIETSSAEDGLPVLLWYNGRFTSTHTDSWTAKQKHTPEAFIAKMRVTAAQPKPIKIGDHTVEFCHGHIYVGGFSIKNDIVRGIIANPSIAEKLQD